MVMIQAHPLKRYGVFGPVSSIDNEVPVFDGVTGKKVKAGTGLIITTNLMEAENKAVVFSGATGGVTVSGVGRRLMWIPEKAVFRAGSVFGTEWDDVNIGYSSFASGTAVKATGWGSFAQGYTGSGGNGLLSTNFGSFAQGYSSYAGIVESTDCGTFAQGFAEGAKIQSSKMGSFAQGLVLWQGDIIASGMGSFAQGYAVGDIIASSDGSFAQGADVVSSGLHAVCIGKSLRALSEYSFVIGRGMQLSAAASHSFAFGYHTSAVTLTQPNTFYIFPAGTAGKVAVGTQTPAISAIMDLTSTIGALLLSRMTTVQKNILTAVNGMLLYDTTLNKFQGYENGAWTNLI